MTLGSNVMTMLTSAGQGSHLGEVLSFCSQMNLVIFQTNVHFRQHLHVLGKHKHARFEKGQNMLLPRGYWETEQRQHIRISYNSPSHGVSCLQNSTYELLFLAPLERKNNNLKNNSKTLSCRQSVRPSVQVLSKSAVPPVISRCPYYPQKIIKPA